MMIHLLWITCLVLDEASEQCPAQWSCHVMRVLVPAFLHVQIKVRDCLKDLAGIRPQEVEELGLMECVAFHDELLKLPTALGSCELLDVLVLGCVGHARVRVVRKPCGWLEEGVH